MKKWEESDIYNVADEFNRIESFIVESGEWISLLFDIELRLDSDSKTNWTIVDIPDVNDIIRIKRNINRIQSVLSINNALDISESTSLNFSYIKANEIENILNEINIKLGDLQLQYQISGFGVSGQYILNGVR